MFSGKKRDQIFKYTNVDDLTGYIRKDGYV